MFKQSWWEINHKLNFAYYYFFMQSLFSFVICVRSTQLLDMIFIFELIFRVKISRLHQHLHIFISLRHFMIKCFVFMIKSFVCDFINVWGTFYLLRNFLYLDHIKVRIFQIYKIWSSKFFTQFPKFLVYDQIILHIYMHMNIPSTVLNVVTI